MSSQNDVVEIVELDNNTSGNGKPEEVGAVQETEANAAAAAAASALQPLAVGQVDRVAKQALPSSATGEGGAGGGVKLSKEARIALHKAANISVIMMACMADEARMRSALNKNGKVVRKVRETLTSADVTAGLNDAGMQRIVEKLDNPKKRKKA